MSELSGITVIEKLLEADKNACQVLEEAKEKANIIIRQAKIEARKLIDKTKSDIQQNHESLKGRLFFEGEKEIDNIITEKKKYLQKIEKHALQQHKQVIQKLRKILFDDL